MKKLLVMLVLMSACQTIIEPVPPLNGSIYVLQSIEGLALPAPYAPNPSFGQRIIADTLAMSDDNTGVRRTVKEGDPDASQRVSEETEFTYLKSGNRIEITFICPSLGLCIQPPHLVGTFTVSGGLTFTQSVVSRQPLVYRWLFPPD